MADVNLEEVERKVLARLRRIEGQAQGIQRMIQEKRSCEEIVIQLAALKSAVEQATLTIAGTHLVQCIRQEMDGEADWEKIQAKFMEVFKKLS